MFKLIQLKKPWKSNKEPAFQHPLLQLPLTFPSIFPLQFQQLRGTLNEKKTVKSAHFLLSIWLLCHWNWNSMTYPWSDKLFMFWLNIATETDMTCMLNFRLSWFSILLSISWFLILFFFIQLPNLMFNLQFFSLVKKLVLLSSRFLLNLIDFNWIMKKLVWVLFPLRPETSVKKLSRVSKI